MTATVVRPELTGELDADRRAVAGRSADVEAQLATLPEPADRSGAERARAADLHADARRRRTVFLARHAEAVYAELVADHPDGRPLADLADAAAESFPGLAPDRAQLAQERRRRQADREGREIDQGILFGALLAAPAAGTHLVTSMRRPTGRARELRERYGATGQVVLTAARLDRAGSTGQITFTNTDCLNAEDDTHVADLETLVDLVLLDPATRVGTLRGGVVTHPRYAGRRVFSAGVNLRHLAAGRISYVDFLLRRELGYLAKMVRGLVGDGPAWPDPVVQKPWLAVVDSFAIGGGAQILLACDRVVAASDAYVSLPAANEGIVPGAANLRLTRLVGARAARRLILGGRPVHATDADAALLLDDVADPAELDAVAARAARELDGPAVAANRRMLNLAEEPEDDFRRYLAVFAVQQALRVYARDVVTRG